MTKIVYKVDCLQLFLLIEIQINKMNQSNNNNGYSIQEGMKDIREGSPQSSQHIKPILLPYHEYIAMQKKNSGNQGTVSSTPVNNSNGEYRNYSQPYYSNTRATYPSPYYSVPSTQSQTSYTLPPYNQYHRQSFSQQHPYYNHQQQPLQPYNYYYNNQQPINNNTLNTHLQPLQTSSQFSSYQSGQNIKNTANSLLNNQANSVIQEINKNSYIQVSYEKPSQTNSISNSIQKNTNQSYYSPIDDKKVSQSPQKSVYKKQTFSNTKKDFQSNNKGYQSKYQQQNQFQNPNLSSNDDWSEQQEQEQVIYQRYQNRKNNYQSKTKTINKKKDPVLDDPQEVKKWIEARKRNYPGLKKKILQLNNNNLQQNQMNHTERQQMSKLQYKIRKKLLIVNGDSRSIMKKIKNIDILRRIIQDPKILKRQRKNKTFQNKEKLTQKVQQNIVPSAPQSIIKAEEGQMVEEPINQLKVQIISEQKTPFKEDDSSSSQDSIQPLQVPANKIPRQQIPSQILEVQNQEIIVQKEKIQDNTKLFQFVDKKQTKIQTKQMPKRQSKVLDPQMIIAHLKQKQQEDRESLNTLFDYKSNSHSYNYRVQTLQTSLKLDQIFAETTYLLQAIRYIVKENFFDQ